MVSALDEERERLQLTNGEMLVINTVMLAGLLPHSSKDILTMTLGFLLHAVKDGVAAPETDQALRHLMALCAVEVHPDGIRRQSS